MASNEPQELSEAVLKHAKAYFAGQKTTEGSSASGSFDEYLRQLTDPQHSESLPEKVDLTLPISQYYISSSHNTYLTGNQLWSKASIEPYKNVLLRGCRCIEVDVWNGSSSSLPSPASSDEETGGTVPQSAEGDEGEVQKLTGLVRKKLNRLRSSSDTKDIDQRSRGQSISSIGESDLMPTPWRADSGRNEPRVLHGYTATKEISFRSVCEVIREYAFCSSDLPLIVSLEVHCNHAQQAIMVELMTDYWKEFLVRIPDDFSEETPLPSLESLKRKILVKVKYVASREERKMKSKHLASPDLELRKSTSDGDSSDEEGQIEKKKKGKIIEPLSKLGTYIRACHFESLDQPEALIPTHVFALSENKLLGLLEQHQPRLFQHNLRFFMRAYPKGTRIRSTNLDPAPLWRQGIQMVALNWQQIDAAMMLNDAMFASSSGWVTKPVGFRYVDAGQAAPIKRVTIDISIKLLAAQNLDPESRSPPKAYVKCELHVESRSEKDDHLIPNEGKSKGGELKRRSRTSQSQNPDLGGEELEFKSVPEVIPSLSFIRFKIMDEDAFHKDRLLSWVCFRLDRFPRGLRLLRLKGLDGKESGACLLIDVRVEMNG